MKLSELMREIAIIIIFLIVIGSMFILHYAVSNINKEFNKKIISNEIIGKVVQIGGPVQPPPPPPPSQPPKPTVIINGTSPPEQPHEESPEPVITNENVRCWKRAGIRNDDITIISNVLSGIKCEIIKERKKIDAKIEDNCLVIDISNETLTNLCFIEEKPPDIKIGIPSGGSGIGIYEGKRAYYGWILFLLFVLTIFLMWGRFEFREHQEKKIKEEYRHIFEGFGVEPEPKIKYIEPPPKYKKGIIPPKIESEDIGITHSKLMEELPEEEKDIMQKIKIKSDDFPPYINKFNELARLTNESLIKNNLKQARKIYLELFPVYTKLFNSLDEQKKKEIQDVIKYLHDQINIMEKGRKIRHLIEEAYREAKKYKVEEPKKKTEESKQYSYSRISDFNPVREYLEKEDYENAIDMFNKLGGKIEKKDETDIYNIPITKGEVLDEIDLIHKKLDERKDTVYNDKIIELKKELDELRQLITEAKDKEAMEKYKKIFTTKG